jgi:hypothetical protein
VEGNSAATSLDLVFFHLSDLKSFLFNYVFGKLFWIYQRVYTSYSHGLPCCIIPASSNAKIVTEASADLLHLLSACLTRKQDGASNTASILHAGRAHQAMQARFLEFR